MKAGKISNTILDRSIVKVISKKPKSKLLNRPAPGHDCSAWVCDEYDNIALVSGMGYGDTGVYTAVNNLAVEGVRATAIQCSVVMPATNREIALKRVMNRINQDCLELDVEIAGGHTQISAAVSEPIISITATGLCPRDKRLRAASAKPEQDIVLTKWIGIGGARALIDRKREELVAHFNEATVEIAYGKRNYLSVVEEAGLAKTAGVTAMHDVSQGGIYAALWDMAEAAHIGLDVDFRAIPVSQEIIEVCEMYDINPYELDSTGCLLMTTEDGCAIVDMFEEHGIPAAVIGRTVAGNDRVIRNRDEVRYLEAPKPDEIHRFEAEYAD